MPLENVLVARICHDLITPCNAISLGLDAFQSSNDKQMLSYVKEGVDKANTILKFTRELFSKKSDDFLYQARSLNDNISVFAKTYNIEASLSADTESISCKIGQSTLFFTAILRDLIPYGGKASFFVDSNSLKLVYSGQNIVAFKLFDSSQELTSRNVLLFKLSELLSEASAKVFCETVGQIAVCF